MKTSVSPNKPNTTNARAVAAQALDNLLKQQGSLTNQLAGHKARTDFPLLQEMCFGSCRWFIQLQWLLSQLLSKPLKKKDSDIYCLLIVGLYQLRHMSLPDYAVINETVNGTKRFKKPWSKGLVNAILRSYLREKDRLSLNLASASLAVQSSTPLWLYEQIQSDWPEQAEDYFEASNQRPPMVLRVNESIMDRPSYLSRLNNQAINGAPGCLAPSAIYLEKAIAVTELPGFLEGEVSVQDESSQLIPPLLKLSPHQTILDACAAPGGKCCHILESECALTSLTAIDISSNRIAKIQENLDRLKLNANLITADVSELKQWWDKQPFDRVLLDAPCSATGIIRRHPDIKILRTPENVAELNKIQLQLLESVWQCVKPGGFLLYTTCSVLKSENSEIIEKFLKNADDAKYEGIAADWGVECSFGRQLLPAAADGPDGFFFSLLRKASVQSSPQND